VQVIKMEDRLLIIVVVKNIIKTKHIRVLCIVDKKRRVRGTDIVL